MDSRKVWIPLDRIRELIQLEPALALLCLGVLSWLLYRSLLRRVSVDRHAHLKSLFMNLLGHSAFCLAAFAGYAIFETLAGEGKAYARIAAYLGVVTLASEATVFVKCSRILLFEYLFLGHMKEGVPVLLVNLYTLLLTLVLGTWLASEIFALNLTPLLATSAVVSLVLGLAVQDTLGNLFAGVALQFDKPYSIGDWVEISGGGNKLVGQVHEISWRATVLLGFSNEMITVPNRLVGQAQVTNYTNRRAPLLRSRTYRIPYGADPERARSTLLACVSGVDGVLADPGPLVFLQEAGESWMEFKLCYFVSDFAEQFAIADRVNTAALAALAKRSIPLAAPRLSAVIATRASVR